MRIAEGKYQDQAGHTEMNCIKCPKGTFSNAVATTSPCEDCAAGKYEDSTGQTKCSSCGTGHATADTGATECPRCEAGTFSSDGSGTGLNLNGVLCEDCAPGYWEVATSSTQCDNCAS